MRLRRIRSDLFLDPYPEDGEAYVYHLQTPWKMLYPKVIEKKLRSAGYRVLDYPKGGGCDVWDPLFTTKAAGVNRASVNLNWLENHDVPIQRTRPWVIIDRQNHPRGEVSRTRDRHDSHWKLPGGRPGWRDFMVRLTNMGASASDGTTVRRITGRRGSNGSRRAEAKTLS